MNSYLPEALTKRPDAYSFSATLHNGMLGKRSRVEGTSDISCYQVGRGEKPMTFSPPD